MYFVLDHLSVHEGLVDLGVECFEDGPHRTLWIWVGRFVEDTSQDFVDSSAGHACGRWEERGEKGGFALLGVCEVRAGGGGELGCCVELPVRSGSERERESKEGGIVVGTYSARDRFAEDGKDARVGYGARRGCFGFVC